MLTTLLLPLVLLLTTSVSAESSLLKRSTRSVAKKAFKFAHFPLDTPWTSKVSIDHPWPEYPRPQLRRSSYLNLNGVWLFNGTNTTNIATNATNWVPKRIPKLGEYEKKILVPYCQESGLSGVGERSTFSWYRTTFKAVDWQATVFINGARATVHRGGYSRFSVDISNFIHKDHDKANELVVFAFDPTDTDGNVDIPIGKQTSQPSHIFYTPCSGIWQTVWLEHVPSHYIRNVVFLSDMNGQVNATIHTSSAASPEPPHHHEEPEPHHGGHPSGSGSGSGSNEHHGSHSHHHGSGSSSHHHGHTTHSPKATISFLKPGTKDVFFSTSGPVNQPFVFTVPGVSTWSPDHPQLYDVIVEWEQDKIESYTGFRSIEKGQVQGVTRPLLNGEFVFQFGTLDQGFWPDGIYTAPTYDAMVYDLKTLKKLGFNFLRKHIKVEPDLFYHAADKLGIMLWQDMPSVQPSSSPTGEWKANFDEELFTMIHNHMTFPSIITWVLFNEGWGQGVQYNAPEVPLTTDVRSIDPSRLINSVTGWNDHGAGDFSDNHHYSSPQCGTPFISTASSPYDPSRIGVSGEFGGIGENTTAAHLWKVEEAVQQINQTYELDFTIPNYWTFSANQVWNFRTLQVIGELRLQTELFSCSAGVYTQTTDVEGEVNGLLTYDRRVLRPIVSDFQQAIANLYAAGARRAKGTETLTLDQAIDAECCNANLTSAVPLPKRDMLDFGFASGAIDV